MDCERIIDMRKKAIWLSMIMAGIGLLDSIYLLIFKLSDNNAMCLGSGGCSTVNASRYSELYNIPVSLYGVMAFLVIALLLIFELKNIVTKGNSNLLLFGISLVGVIFSSYLTYIEFYVIYAVCPFCVISAVVMTIIFIISATELVRSLNN